MKISPVNNNKQNTNFGMVRVVDANDSKLAKEAWELLIYIKPKHAVYRPFRVADALNYSYTPRSTTIDGVFQQDGGRYLGGDLFEDKLSTYQAEADKTFIFQAELSERNRRGRTIPKWFDEAFNNPVKIKMEQLREYAADIRAKREAQKQAEEALAAAKTATETAQNDILTALGAIF